MKVDQIEVVDDHPLDYNGDGLIHPTTCSNAPEGEWIEGLLDAAGDRVLENLQSEQPLRIGNVHVTENSNLPFRRIVHLPVQTAPDVPTTEDNIQIALRSGLVAIDKPPVCQLIIPKLIPESGTEDLELNEVTHTIIHDLIQYPPQSINRIVFSSTNGRWCQALRDSVEEFT